MWPASRPRVGARPRPLNLIFSTPKQEGRWAMQKMTARAVAGLLLILFMGASCISNNHLVPERMYPGPPLPQEKKAILYEGSSLFEDNMAVHEVRVKIVSVDGKKVKINKSWVEVLPGMHTVGCSWYVELPHRYVSGYVVKGVAGKLKTITLETKANHIYHFDAEIYEAKKDWRINVKEGPIMEKVDLYNN